MNFHWDVPLCVTPFVWGMNTDKHNAMSAAQKKAIDDHCTAEWVEKVGTAWASRPASRACCRSWRPTLIRLVMLIVSPIIALYPPGRMG